MKKLVNPKDYLLPFKITFPEDVEVTINGMVSHFPAGMEVELSVREFEAIKHSGYGKHIYSILKKL